MIVTQMYSDHMPIAPLSAFLKMSTNDRAMTFALVGNKLHRDGVDVNYCSLPWVIKIFPAKGTSKRKQKLFTNHWQTPSYNR